MGSVRGVADLSGATLAHQLIREGKLHELEELLESHDYSVQLLHEKDRLGITPLHAAVEAGQHEIVHFLLKSQYINVNSADRHGWTALHTACHKGDLEIIELLLVGAWKNKVQGKLLHQKERKQGKDEPARGELSESPLRYNKWNSCDINASTIDLSTPLHYFVRHPPPAEKKVNMMARFGSTLLNSSFVNLNRKILFSFFSPPRTQVDGAAV